MNLRTALYSTHVSRGARMVAFGGWDMPVQYSSILAEVRAVRTATGVFDVSHMGRLSISGPQAGEFLDWVLTGSASDLRIGRARYCMICNESGGVIDDSVFYRLAEDQYLLVCNAANRSAVVSWFQRWIDEKFSGDCPHARGGEPRPHLNPPPQGEEMCFFPPWGKVRMGVSGGCTVEDLTQATALIAFQGPGTPEVLDQLWDPGKGVILWPHPRSPLSIGDGEGVGGEAAPSTMRPFSWRKGTFLGKPAFVGRTGYTGEDGFEVAVAAVDAELVWHSLVGQGAVPCGLGARDVLRLEAGLPLHGHEIDPGITPIEAGLQRFVRFDKKYVGSDVLLQQRDLGVGRKLVGLKLPGRSAPRAGYPILDRGQEVGKITSGSYSPTLDMSIAMGYVLVRYATPGQELDVDIRGRADRAEVVSLPFYTHVLSRAEGRARRRPGPAEGRSQSN